MFEKPQSSHVLGLTIDGFSLKGAVMSHVRGKLNLETTFDFPLKVLKNEEKEDVKLLYTNEQKEEIQTLSESHLVVTSADTQDILVRPLELKLKKEKDIEATLSFQIEPLLPYPAENSVLDKVLLSKDKEGSRLTVFAIRKDHLIHHLNQWKALDIEPEVVSAAPQALVLFANHFIGHDAPFFIVHLAVENSFAVLVDQGKVLAAQALSTSIGQLILALSQKNDSKEAIFEDLLTIDFNSFEDPHLKSALDSMRMSIARTLYALAKPFKGKEVGNLLVTGAGTLFTGLTETLCLPLKKTLLHPKEDLNIGIDETELLSFALPIGEALSALPKCNEQINFRQKEFTYPEPWKRLKQPISLYFFLCLGLAIALFLFGKSYISYQEGELKQHYLTLLNAMNKSYPAFEKEFLGKFATPLPTEEMKDIPDIATLSLEDIQSRLNFLDKEIKSTPQTFPLFPNVPLVSDVLAWISSHPSFVGHREESNDSTSSMHIENFTYTMVKRPEPIKKQDKYQVKVEIEFSSPTPKMAREFHDALIAPNDMVDTKAEIKWNSNRNRYRTSFFLKDKTIYLNL